MDTLITTGEPLWIPLELSGNTFDTVISTADCKSLVLLAL
jgi:hypothetical protein